MNGLLKFITCGSVDDGKSTMIGHILYNAKLLYADQEQALKLDSKVGQRRGEIDYSLLLDGLMAEREQGITIDVAYRYFTTDKRSFIVADTPGHEEYTRNMAVGASFADLAVILIDATKGVLVQTRRHARICALMGIKYFVFAVNKMDLVDYSEARFNEVLAQIQELQKSLNLQNVIAIPLSATEGDNLTQPSEKLSWFKGPVLLDYLEQVDVETEQEEGFYLPIQRVSRPNYTFRGFQGEIESGEIKVGDTIMVLPSGEKAQIKGILVAGKEAETACKGQPVSVQLNREVDISRGCVLVKDTSPAIANEFECTLLWMDDENLTENKNYFVKLGTKMVPGQVTKILYTTDVNTGETQPADHLEKNELARCRIHLTQPCVMDRFKNHKTLGELILIDRITNATSACGVIEEIHEYGTREMSEVTPQVRAEQKGQTPCIILADSLEEARKLECQLVAYGNHTMIVESGENLLFAARLLLQAGLIVLIPRDIMDDETYGKLKESIPEEQFLEGKNASDLNLRRSLLQMHMQEDKKDQ